MNEITPYINGRKLLTKGRDAAMELGEMIGEPGAITYGMALVIELLVEASADTAALTNAQVEDVLDSLKFYFKPSHCLSAEIETYQNETLLDIRNDCRRLLRRDYRDVADDTTGLKQPFLDGNNVLTFTVYVPFAYARHIMQASKVMGLGRVQMLDSSARVKVESDAFKAASANLTLKDSHVTFAPLWENGHARFIGIPMLSVALVAPEKKSLKTDPGLVLSVEQEVPLADTLLEELTIKVGGVTVTREQTPEVIQRAYEEGPGFSASEDLISLYRTALYVPKGDTEFAQLQTGAVEVAQTKLLEAWKVRALYLPYLTTQQVFDLVKREAEDIKPGQQILAINAAVYDGVDVNEEQLPFAGFVVLESTDPAFYEHQGIRCAHGGEPEVYIPPHMAENYARRIVDVMKPSATFPQGAGGAADGVREEAAWRIPAFIVHPDGSEYTSHVASQVERILKGAVAEQEQKASQAAGLMAQLQALVGRKGGAAAASPPARGGRTPPR